MAAYAKTRAESAPLPSGSAPYTTSSFFKLRPQKYKPLAKDWTHHLSTEGKSQSTSTLKEASKNASKAKLLSLGTARPAPEFYPWESLTMSTRTVASRSPEESPDVITSTSCAKSESNFDLGVALNYGYAAGSPQLLRFITEHVEMVHSPPYRDWESCLTCSTTSAIDILFRILFDRGDWIITEEYTYPGTVEAAKRMGMNIMTVAIDEDGLVAEDLDRKLCQWDPATRKPSVLYMIPSGHNPTGLTQSTRRRKDIYAIAEKHDLLIIEDDPYYFIQLEAPSIVVNGSASLSRSDQYLHHLLPSYLFLDTSGRVLRLETASKILAPGLRCGWMTGCSQLVSKFLSAIELSVVAPNGPSQAMLYKLLDESWGHGGFINWLDDLSSRFRHRLEVMVSSCEKHLPASICTWSMPKSGMFLWIQLDWACHPIFRSRSASRIQNSDIILEIEDRVHQACRYHGIQVSKGSWFAPTRSISNKLFFRVTFAAAAEPDLVQAVAKFGQAVCEEFRTHEI